jgi:DNA-directed RNA polymerase subunit RPC12/RpoP
MSTTERVAGGERATSETARGPAPGFGPTQTILDKCAERPDEATHECRADAYQCIRCGDALKPYPCNECDSLLTPEEMADGEVRCRACRTENGE